MKNHLPSWERTWYLLPNTRAKRMDMVAMLCMTADEIAIGIAEAALSAFLYNNKFLN
jgi:hypothetical protein